MKQPKVSIVVPVYNVEKYLKLCIDSAISQTLSEIEIICIDDGSTDSSGKILDDYANRDSRVKVVHKANEGYGVAMNIGLEMATGEYFAVLESDDFVKPKMYETLYETAKKYSAEVVRSNYFDLSIQNDVTILQEKSVVLNDDFYYRLICPNKEKIVYSFVMHNWTGIYDIDFLRRNSIRYNTTHGASYQDNGFYFQVFAKVNRLVYVPNNFYCYRIDNPNSSINNPQKVYDMTKEYDFIKDKLTEYGLFEELIDVYLLRRYKAFNQTFLRISKDLKDDYLEYFQDELLKSEKAGQIDWDLFSPYEKYEFKVLLNSKDDFASATALNKTVIDYLIALKCKLKYRFGLY